MTSDSTTLYSFQHNITVMTKATDVKLSGHKSRNTIGDCKFGRAHDCEDAGLDEDVYPVLESQTTLELNNGGRKL